MRVVFTMANNSSVPYFNWFAEYASQQNEFEFIFICLYPTKPKMLEEMHSMNCKSYWVPFDSKSRMRSMITAFFRLSILFVRLRPDVVHSHLFDDSVPALLAAWLTRIKRRVITKADAGFHWFYVPRWVIFDKLNNWLATDIVAISSENKYFVKNMEKADIRKISLVPHGIPIKNFQQRDHDLEASLSQKYGLKNKKIVGNISRLIKWKGQEMILQAAKKILEQQDDVFFVLVGVGAEEDYLRSVIASLGIEDHVLMIGWLDPMNIPSLYHLMDVYVHAAQWEPFGFVIAEAVASGVPVVSTKTGAADDLIAHDVNGYLVGHDDVPELSIGITKALRKEFVYSEPEYSGLLEEIDFSTMWRRHLNLYYNRAQKETKG